jgi:hypothetical protein
MKETIKMKSNINIEQIMLDHETGMCLRPLASKYGMSTATMKKHLNNAGVDTSRRPCFTEKVWDLIKSINKILDEYKTRLTVRQVYYQLASRRILPLSQEGYNGAKSALTKGRRKGYVPWEKIEDRTRQPHTPIMWKGIDGFKEYIMTAYRRNIWMTQTTYFEVWLEKRALYGVIAPITRKYGVTLQTITGYSSLSAVYDGAKRLKDGDTILYLGDHDATGVDIDRSVRDSFKDDHGLDINVVRIGLLYEDIEKYDLPPNFEKEGDKRLKGYRAKGYTKQAELDALPPDVLVGRVESAIQSHLDMEAYRECLKTQKKELNEIQSRFGGV